jgi:dipeptidyl aminopeptidase/acylaminoacyl peptidase
MYLALSVVLISAAACTSPRCAELNESELEALASQFVSVWSQGDYNTATVTFDETMLQMMPPEKMKEAWESLIARVGAFKGEVGTRTEKWNDYTIVFVTCDFEISPIDIKVVYDGKRRIAGLWFVPVEQSTAEYETPPYVKPSEFSEEEVTVGSGEWELPGTLTLPGGEGPFPAVVLVHGSGPNDRDETVGPNRPFRDLAWGLATSGIAVLRYEKRTKVHGAKMIMMEGGFTIAEETIDDALAAVDLLGGMERIDGNRIFVLGHSLGGMCIPRIGTRDPDIAGLIIMAGATRPLEDLLVEQYTYIFTLDDTISEGERAELDKIEAQAAAVKDPALSPDTPRDSLPLGSDPRYWLDLRDYDPAGAAAALTHPLMILHGERDYQVTMVDFENWKVGLSSHTDAVFKSYPSLNHLFIAGEGPCTPEEYTKSGHVSEEVVTDIARWIKRH